MSHKHKIQMSLELLPFQLQILEDILKREDIGVVAKAYLLKRDPD